MGRTFGDSIVELFNMLAGIALLLAWLFGFVIAKGFWSTLFCWIPFYSWYLVIEYFFLQ